MSRCEAQHGKGNTQRPIPGSVQVRIQDGDNQLRFQPAAQFFIHIQDFSFRPADIPQLEESDNYWVYDYFAKNAFSLGKQESYESRLDLGGFGWFVLLPKGKYGTCLGLLDKFVGFTAVESIFENDSTQTVVVKESGTLGWLSEKEPQKVMVNSVDVTSSVKKNDFLYEITLPEGPHKMVLSFVW